MNYAMREGVTFCWVNGQAVFFDLDADFISGAPTRANAAFRKLVDGDALDAEEESDLALLVRSNLLVPAGGETVAIAPVEESVPSLDLADVERRAVSPALCASAIARHIAAGAALKSIGLRGVIGALRNRKAKLAVTGGHDAEHTLALAFHWASRFVTANDRCLQRSVALMSALLGRGVAARLVIGVRVIPFAAHSWVQTDTEVLSESTNLARTYRPILLV